MAISTDEYLKHSKMQFCKSCIMRKMTNLYYEERKMSSRLLEINHADVCGQFNIAAHDGEFEKIYRNNFSKFV